METTSSIEDYSRRVFATWHVGQKNVDNGPVLFVFIQDHQLRLETNIGLEHALPDEKCAHIINDQIAPRFKVGDFDGGCLAAVDAMIEATRHEYKGAGRTAEEQHQK